MSLTFSQVGYNINNDDLRRGILNSMRPLRTNSPHYLYRRRVYFTPDTSYHVYLTFCRYAQARQWRGLSQAVQQSTAESPLDEMIQLYHESKKPGWYAAPAGVRCVFYNAIEDVPRLLSEASAPSFLSSLRADAPAFVPRQIHKVDDERAIEVPNSEDLSAGAEVHVDIEEPEVDHTDVMNSTTAIETIANTSTPRRKRVAFRGEDPCNRRIPDGLSESSDSPAQRNEDGGGSVQDKFLQGLLGGGF